MKTMKQIRNLGIALLAILLIGTFGYYFLANGKHSLFNCLYMTVITISTIGFAEVIEMHDNVPLRSFTMFLAFLGIGLLTYFVYLTLLQHFRVKMMEIKHHTKKF